MRFDDEPVRPGMGTTCRRSSASERVTMIWDPIRGLHQGQRPCAVQTGRTHGSTRPIVAYVELPLRQRGRSLIAPPMSTASCLLLLSPYQGHGSLRGRRLPPQHLVRSTGAAMSTTGSRGNHAVQRPPSQPACTLALAGNPHIRTAVRMDFVRRPRAAPTSGTARRTARCCAGSPTACGPTQHAPCQGRTASRSPAPSSSSLKPA